MRGSCPLYSLVRILYLTDEPQSYYIANSAYIMHFLRGVSGEQLYTICVYSEHSTKYNENGFFFSRTDGFRVMEILIHLLLQYLI